MRVHASRTYQAKVGRLSLMFWGMMGGNIYVVVRDLMPGEPRYSRELSARNLPGTSLQPVPDKPPALPQDSQMQPSVSPCAGPGSFICATPT